MNFKHFLPLAALALPLCMQGVPARPYAHPRTLADGTPVTVTLHGDEYFNYITDENGFLLESTKTPGRVAYTLDPSGNRLKATPILLEDMRTRALQTLPEGLQRSAAQGGPARIAPHDSKGQTTFPTTMGDTHFLVILVNFADRKWTLDDPVAEMNRKLNGDTYDYNGSKGSMRQYLIQNSGGKMLPTFDIVGPVELPEDAIYYTGGQKYGMIQDFVTQAVALADPLVDFSNYDYDGDSQVDNVIFFYAGYGQADTNDTSCIWPHNSTIINKGIQLDGKMLGNYCCFNELNGGSHYYNQDGALDGLGTPLHEFGHVMGFPDLYDPKYECLTTPGTWSIFDGGCYNGDGYVPPLLSSYERFLLKWAEPEVLSEPTHVELQSLYNGGGAKRVNVVANGTTYSNEFFLFESRDLNGWDSGLKYGGMLIWHIDYDRSIFTSNRVNSDASRNRVQLITADGSASYLLGSSNANAEAAAWPRKINYLTPDTDIKLYVNYLRARGPLPHYFTDIAYDEQSGVSSFDFDAITSSPDATTVMHTPIRHLTASGNPSRTVYLSWDAVPEADDYLVSLYRIASNGKKYYEQSFDQKPVGLVTSVDIEIPTNKLDIEFHAYVTPKVKIPSIRPSNEVSFVTSQLETAGVESIETQPVPVRGLKGEIDAPMDARIFTLTGAPAPRTGLTPGIYLVQTQGKTCKVTVK